MSAPDKNNMSNPKIDSLTSEVIEIAKQNAAATEAWTAKLQQFQVLLDQLTGISSSAEIKLQFQTAAIVIAEEGVKLSEIRKHARRASDQLLEEVKAAGVEEYEADGGVVLTLARSIQVKIPKEEEEGSAEEKSN